jgi:molecular chaperone HscB
MTAYDPFAELGIPLRFDINAAEVERAYLRQTALLHPDRLTDPGEQAEAIRRAARVNDARRDLLDDERRANIVLEHRGGPSQSDDQALPDGFLMEVMETREAMEAAEGDEAELARWRAWAKENRAERLERIAGLFAGVDDDRLPPDVAHTIRVELNALRYVERMIEQLDPNYDHEQELRDASRRR